MTKGEILENVLKVNGHLGMTVNVRLYMTGLMDMFEKVKRTDKELARFILKTILFENLSIDKILTQTK